MATAIVYIRVATLICKQEWPRVAIYISGWFIVYAALMDICWNNKR